MLRRARLKPTGFKPKPRKEGPSVEKPERPLIPATVKPLRMGVYGGTTSCQPVAKECASQSPAYQKACKALGYCMRCGARHLPLDFCHRDQTKGIGIKTDVREGWPGCRPCHHFVGTSGKLSKEARRAEELMLGAKTRAAVCVAGLWPARLPLWNE